MALIAATPMPPVALIAAVGACMSAKVISMRRLPPATAAHVMAIPSRTDTRPGPPAGRFSGPLRTVISTSWFLLDSGGSKGGLLAQAGRPSCVWTACRPCCVLRRNSRRSGTKPLHRGGAAGAFFAPLYDDLVKRADLKRSLASEHLARPANGEIRSGAECVL
jgi:hypothetical protein